MKCAICKTQFPLCVLKFALCSHYVCSICAARIRDATGGVIQVAEDMCDQCYSIRHGADYTKECPTCFVTYSAECTRSSHDCLDDEGVFDM